MTTEMAPYNPYSGFSAEMPDRPISNTGGGLPRISICQPTSLANDDGIPQGNFYITAPVLDEDAGQEEWRKFDLGKELVFVPLAIQHLFNNWERDKEGKWKITCRSNDAKTCSGDYANAARGLVVNCPRTEFRQEDGIWKRPLCTEVLRFLVYSKEVGQVGTFDFSSTTLNQGWDVTDDIKAQQRGNVGYKVTLELRNKNGRYFAPVMTPLPVEQAQSLALVGVQQMESANKPALMDAPPEPPADAPSAPAWQPPPPMANNDPDGLPF